MARKPRRRAPASRRLVTVAAGVGALIVAGGIIRATFQSGPASAAPPCRYNAALREFRSHGFGTTVVRRPVTGVQTGRSAPSSARTDPVYGSWLKLYCRGMNLGPATSETRDRHGVWAQEFRRTAHRITWRTGWAHARVRTQRRVASRVFSQHGIKPQWNLPIPAAWLRAFYAGTDYGPALEPVNATTVVSISGPREQQAYAHSTGTFARGSVTWLPAPAGRALSKSYQADRWRPIARAVHSFAVAVKQQDEPLAARYLTRPLARRAFATCPQALAGLGAVPTRVRFAIQLWNVRQALVKTVFVGSSGRTTDRFDLRKGRVWTIHAIRRIRGGTKHPTCPPWSPPANAFPGTYSVGDSVMVDAQYDLQLMGITVDAMVDRQFDTGIAILQQLKSEGRLPPRVVIGLGTNGGMTEADYESALRMLSGEKRVVLLTVREPRSWEGQVNQLVHVMARKFKNVRVADFYAISAGHPQWFATDGIHIGPAGALAFAHVIANALAEP